MKDIQKKSDGIFKVSPVIIWLSSVSIGILASIPKILQLHITIAELALDASLAFFFSLIMWFYNLSRLPKFSVSGFSSPHFIIRLAYSIGIGVAVMIALVMVHQLFFPDYSFKSMLLMYQFRGILINLTVFMFIHFLYQSYHAQQVSLQLERVKADSLNARYELLKQQVNPHFLFNSLNTLKVMIDVHDADASNFVVKLSNFYRFSLDSRKEDLIPLRKELEILEAYIFLLQSRFEEGISVQIDLGEEAKATFIPPFTLQLLAENCIKHNVVSIENPLYIRIFEDNGCLIIRNNQQPRNASEESSGIGLSNIKERYRHIGATRVEIMDTDQFFIIKLPFIHGYSNH